MSCPRATGKREEIVEKGKGWCESNALVFCTKEHGNPILTAPSAYVPSKACLELLLQ